MHFESSMTNEARNWIKNNHRKTFIVKDIDRHKSLVNELNSEEVKVYIGIQNYILERLRVAKIKKIKKKISRISIMASAQGGNKMKTKWI